MNRFSLSWLRTVGPFAAALLLLGLPGCSRTPQPSFRINLEGRNPLDFQLTGHEKDEQERTDKEQRQAALETISTVLYAFFGTPDDPYVLPESGLDLRKIQIASGPSFNPTGQQRGLYRQQCAQCHGISGDGAGPTAVFLNPYPRDYRKGQFKFKSTERSARPTTADLRRVLDDGIAGTAMPSFVLLPEDEKEALVEYVKYLAIRGQTEELLADMLLNQGESINLAETSPSELIASYVTPVTQPWQQADTQIIEITAARPAEEQRAESVKLGAELFRGGKSQCTKCHGPTALGDGSEELLFDDWNKVKKFADISKRLSEAENIAEKKERREEVSKLFEELAVEERSWLLPQQQIQPRNLRLGTYRFGRRPADIYRRIQAGINGTPMASMGATPDNPSGLTPEEIWHLVDYVLSLPYESLSEPAVGRGNLPGMGGAHGPG